MVTKHEFTEHELNLILMALDFVTHYNAFDFEEETTAKKLMVRLSKEFKEQVNEKHNSQG